MAELRYWLLATVMTIFGFICYVTFKPADFKPYKEKSGEGASTKQVQVEDGSITASPAAAVSFPPQAATERNTENNSPPPPPLLNDYVQTSFTAPLRNAFPELKVRTAERDALVLQHRISCGDRSSLPLKEVPYSSAFKVHHFGGDVGLTRFWLQSLTAFDTQCRGGDVYDVTIRSDDTLVTPARVVDLETGLYEVQAVIPTPGEYTVCVDMFLSQAHKEAPWYHAFTHNISMMGKVNTYMYPHTHDNNKKYCVGNAMKRQCLKGTYEGSAQDRAKLPRCNPNDGSALQGYWHKPAASKCVPGICEGSMDPSYEGWIFLPYDCYLKLFSFEETWTCFDKKWFLGWGESTMKQAMSNFVEYSMRTPIFQDTMENLDKLRATMRKPPGFFSYRQWDITREKLGKNVHISMMWAGCPNIAGLPNCRNIGILHKTAVEGLFNKSPDGLPDVISVSFHIWRLIPQSEQMFLEAIRDWVNWLKKIYQGRNKPLPLVIWNNSPRQVNNVDSRCLNPGNLAHEHTAWAVEDFFKNNVTGLRVARIDRLAITQPFHFEELGFVHAGIHYGATKGMCTTGLSHKAHYEFSKCVKKTYPEAMINQMWLNYMCSEG
jgi:hypothetical protein